MLYPLSERDLATARPFLAKRKKNAAKARQPIALENANTRLATIASWGIGPIPAGAPSVVTAASNNQAPNVARARADHRPQRHASSPSGRSSPRSSAVLPIPTPAKKYTAK